MTDLEQLAELIFPDVTETIEDLEKRYPKRNLPEGAIVARFAGARVAIRKRLNISTVR